MKLGLTILSLLALLISPSLRADEIRLDDVVARATRDVVVRSALEDNALLDLCHRSLLEASGAEVSLAFPLPPGVRLQAGPITVRQALALAPKDEPIVVVELTAARLEELLETGAQRLPAYAWDEGSPLVAPAADDSAWITADGVSYEIDLTAPPGRRVVHLALRGGEPAPNRTIRVAATARTWERLGVSAPSGAVNGRLQDALLARMRRMATIDDACDHHWSVLPDYAPLPERPLIDRLVRLGVAPREEVIRLYPDQPALRGDLGYWLARAYGWREARLSGAFPDLPDSLEPWWTDS